MLLPIPRSPCLYQNEEVVYAIPNMRKTWRSSIVKTIRRQQPSDHYPDTKIVRVPKVVDKDAVATSLSLADIVTWRLSSLASPLDL